MKPYFVLIVYMNIFYKLLQLFAPIIYNIYAIYSTFDLDIALNLTELRDVKLFTNLRASNIIKNKKIIINELTAHQMFLNTSRDSHPSKIHTAADEQDPNNTPRNASKHG